MPRIPYQQQLISSDVSFANPSSGGAGQVGQSVSNLGDTLTNVGLNIVKEVKTAEARDQSFKAHLDDQLYAQDEIAKLKTQFPDGYYKDQNGDRVRKSDNTGDMTISDVFRDSYKSRFTSNQMKMSTQLGQQMYIAQSGPFFVNSHLRLRSDEQEMQVKSFENNLTTSVKKSGDSVYLTPNKQFMYEQLDTISGRVSSESGKLYSYEHEKKLSSESQGYIADQYVEGKLNEIVYDDKFTKIPGARKQELLKLKLEIEGLDSYSQVDRRGLNTLSDVLSTESKVKYEKRINSMIGDLTKKQAAEYGVFVKNAKAQQKAGQNVIPMVQAVTNSLVEQGSIAPNMANDVFVMFNKEAKVQSIASDPAFMNASVAGRVKMAKEASSKVYESRGGVPGATYENAGVAESQATQSELVGPKGSWNAKYQAIESKSAANFQSMIKGSAQNQLNVLLKNVDSNSWKQNSDLVKHAFQISEEGYVKRHGSLRGYNPLTSQQQQDLITYFKDGDVSDSSNQAKATLLSEIKNATGSKFQIVMQNLIGQNGLPEKWRIVGYITDDLTKIDFMDALTANDSQVKENFEAISGNKTSDVNLYVNQEFRKWAAGVARTSPGGRVNDAVLNGILDFAKTKVMRMGSVPGWGGPRDAARKVFQDVVGRNQHLVDLRTNNGDDYVLPLPKFYDGEETTDDRRENYVSHAKSFFTKENLKAEGVVVLDSRQQEVPQDSPVYDKYLRQIINSGWVAVQNGKTIPYYIPQDSNTEVVLFKKDKTDDKGISPIIIPLDNWLDYPSKSQPNIPNIPRGTFAPAGGR